MVQEGLEETAIQILLLFSFFFSYVPKSSLKISLINDGITTLKDGKMPTEREAEQKSQRKQNKNIFLHPVAYCIISIPIFFSPL